ncbi:MAG: bifunctional nuclease domain-containing protein, partial [Planctomycetota bacterium]
GDWVGRRNEVRIDARPSDCLVLALKNNLNVYVAEEVFSQVQDVSKMTQEVEGNLLGGQMELGFETRESAEPRGFMDEDAEDEDEDFLHDDVDEEDTEGFGGFKP